MKSIKEISIFLSSPGDVREERKAVEEIISSLNKVLGQNLDISIKLERWENLPSGVGNAQELINSRLNTYDIFLGIMAERFGSPTKKSESGTQEEFEAAYHLWKTNSSVSEILFYFRTPQEVPKTPNDAEQLLKVLKFKEGLSTKLMYKSYDLKDDFKSLLRDDLETTIRSILSKINKTHKNKARSLNVSARVKQVDVEEIEQHWRLNKPSTSFFPGESSTASDFIRVRIETSGGYSKNFSGKESYKPNFVTVLKDPIRPFDIQIGETRAMRNSGNPMAIPDLVNLDLASVKNMYPFIQVEGYKWIRMVLAELTTDPKILDYIHSNDHDPQIRDIASKNPSASSDLQKRECIFCQDNFKSKRLKYSGSENTFIIANDYPYGPFFHYIAFPARAVHAWQDLTLGDIADLNVTMWKFLRRERKSKNWSPSPSGVFIGLNSSIKHLVMGTHTRTSAGASISHIHKQMWGMAPGSVNLGNHLYELCNTFSENLNYLDCYLEFLLQEKMIIYEDDHVALYVPFGQISLH
ncbi:MAG TPA: DUF4062 domain-containing protein, partial [Gammaproteobacteria bacterium]|nr:DUF4062 domain-containing protein [Gammaproteobacteria bacterium]